MASDHLNFRVLLAWDEYQPGNLATPPGVPNLPLITSALLLPNSLHSLSFPFTLTGTPLVPTEEPSFLPSTPPNPGPPKSPHIDLTPPRYTHSNVPTLSSIQRGGGSVVNELARTVVGQYTINRGFLFSPFEIDGIVATHLFFFLKSPPTTKKSSPFSALQILTNPQLRCINRLTFHHLLDTISLKLNE